MINQKIDLNNWNYAYFTSGENRIQIFMGLDLSLREIYSVTSTDLEARTDSFQKEFQDLTSAIDFINERYGHLKLILGEAPKEGSGCDTCQAH